jgi:hypothetical protein
MMLEFTKNRNSCILLPGPFPLIIIKIILIWRLTLAEQLNCVCDGLAKAAVFRSIQQLGSRKEPFILPLEQRFSSPASSRLRMSADLSGSVLER